MYADHLLLTNNNCPQVVNRCKLDIGLFNVSMCQNIIEMCLLEQAFK